MSIYRDYNCNSITIKDLNDQIKLSGWIDTIRDHGNLIFIDLRDNYGITQCVIDAKKSIFSEISSLNHETVIKIKGKVLKRSQETINTSLLTGEIEVDIDSFEILSKSDQLPHAVLLLPYWANFEDQFVIMLNSRESPCPWTSLTTRNLFPSGDIS